ncbi:MAG: hypothetical protein V3S11_05550 [Elusimicrobiota bacterium]
MRRLGFIFLVAGAFACASSQTLSERPQQDELRQFLIDYAAAWEQRGTSERIASYERELRSFVKSLRGGMALRGAIDSLLSEWKAERDDLMQQMNSLRVAGRGYPPSEIEWMRTAPLRMAKIDKRGRRLKILRGKLFPASL